MSQPSQNPYEAPRSRPENRAVGTHRLHSICAVYIIVDLVVSSIQAITGLIVGRPLDMWGWVATLTLMLSSGLAITADVCVLSQRKRGVSLGLIAGSASIIAAVVVCATFLERYRESASAETLNRLQVQTVARFVWNGIYLAIFLVLAEKRGNSFQRPSVLGGSS